MVCNGLQCLVALNLLLCSALFKCDIIRISPVILNSTNGEQCPDVDVIANTRQQLHEYVNGLLTALSATDAPTTEMPVINQSELFGGTGGDYFNDYTQDIAGIIGMNIYEHPTIQVTYRLKNGSTHTTPVRGGNWGTMHSFTLAEGERLTRMEGSPADAIIRHLTFYSNLNNMYGPYGNARPNSFFVEGREIVAFFGRSGSSLDAIGVHLIN